MLTFENYFAFLAFLIPPFFFILQKTGNLKRYSLPLLFMDTQGKKIIWKSKRIIFFKVIVFAFTLLAYISAVIALANPKITKYEKRYISRGTEVMFVIDISPSMAAIDLDNNRRIDSAKKAILNIAETMDGTSFGIVSMGSDAACILPPTLDKKAFEEKLSLLKLGELGDGTALGVGIASASYHLSTSSAPQKIIILMTDGENNAGTIHPNTAAKLASEMNIPIYVIGIGTQGTVPIEYTDPISGKTFSGFLDSNFDTESLSKIASISNGRFYEIQSLDDLINVTSSIVHNEEVVPHFYTVSTGTEYYRTFLILSEIFASIAWIIASLFLKEFI